MCILENAFDILLYYCVSISKEIEYLKSCHVARTTLRFIFLEISSPIKRIVNKV